MSSSSALLVALIVLNLPGEYNGGFLNKVHNGKGPLIERSIMCKVRGFMCTPINEGCERFFGEKNALMIISPTACLGKLNSVAE